mgnify:CR=1 FL=1
MEIKNKSRSGSQMPHLIEAMRNCLVNELLIYVSDLDNFILFALSFSRFEIYTFK